MGLALWTRIPDTDINQMLQKQLCPKVGRAMLGAVQEGPELWHRIPASPTQDCKIKRMRPPLWSAFSSRFFACCPRFPNQVDMASPHQEEAHFTQIVLTFTNSSIPKAAHSRPKPEFFTPPKGKEGSERTKSFTKHIPASISLTASRSPWQEDTTAQTQAHAVRKDFAHPAFCTSSVNL